MRMRCEYCGAWIEDTDAVCPRCAALNVNLNIPDDEWPQTIEELIAFCGNHRVPTKELRFFIGRDFRGPRAIGIFRDAAGNVVVYKNRSDASRMVRYRGTDEAYAVNEVLQKLRSEIAQAHEHMARQINPDAYKRRPRGLFKGLFKGLR